MLHLCETVSAVSLPRGIHMSCVKGDICEHGGCSYCLGEPNVKLGQDWKRMSDASEVKRLTAYTIQIDGIDGHEKFVFASDHDRIMAERDELWKRATKFVMPGEMDTGESIERHIKTLEQTVAELRAEVEKHNALHEYATKAVEQLKARIDNQAFILSENTKTIATQARVIEKLKEAHRKNANEDFRGNRTGESIRSFKILEEIAAIEKQGEGT